MYMAVNELYFLNYQIILVLSAKTKPISDFFANVFVAKSPNGRPV